ncbi:MAG TPA: L-2-hydroxyglutarate oxidase [Solirubrobacterales bacterium]|nr:L-2-hydroxyglutarate oxidase [Solirubrobacterales bacterium]
MTPDPLARCDFAIVGAGIVGLATARELARRHPGASVAVLEGAPGIAAHQTGHSSGVIHAGVYYEPGSLKARLCVAGAAELYEYCEEHGIEARASGKLIVATAEEELPGLAELERRARANGVPGIARVGADEIAEIEPHAVGLAALHSPRTGVVDFSRVAGAFEADVVSSGGAVVTGCPVLRIVESGGQVTIAHGRGQTRAGAVAVCAGAWSDRLAIAAGAPKEPRIVPFRGAYLRVRPERAHLVRANIYPVPDPDLPFLGAHLTKGVDDEVLLGPSALLVGARDAYGIARMRGRDLAETLAWPGTWRLALRHRRAALTELRRGLRPRAFATEASRLVPALRPADFTRGPAGVRAQALARDGTLVDDFVVSTTQRTVYVRNAPSPAATSSLPLARLIADRVDALTG